jgi:DNA-binding XRE family transcriptional regulator
MVADAGAGAQGEISPGHDWTRPVAAIERKLDSHRVARWPSNDRSGTWRSSARDAPGVARALTRLGKRVRSLRLERKLTQEQAAEVAKLDEKHWQDIEGARTNPTVATLVGIARALKVTISELFEQQKNDK